MDCPVKRVQISGRMGTTHHCVIQETPRGTGGEPLPAGGTYKRDKRGRPRSLDLRRPTRRDPTQGDRPVDRGRTTDGRSVELS
jgi:hypothetical protein